MRFFGPNQGDIWKLLSKDIDGEWIVVEGIGKKYKVEKKFKDWLITLETASSGNKNDPVFTRMYAKFFNKHGLRFKIFNEHFRNYFISFFDMQDIKVDQNGFSREFIVRSNSEIAMKRFFDNSMIRELMNMEYDLLFEINGQYGQEVEKDRMCTIEMKIPGVIKNNEFLKNLFELIAASLLEIEKLNNEYETLDVNNFSKFSVVKKSIKNVITEKVSYEEVKENILNKISKKKNPSKDEEQKVEIIEINSEMSSEQEKEDETLPIEKNISVEAYNVEEVQESLSEMVKENNNLKEDLTSSENTTDLNEYLKTLSVFNLDSSDSESK